MHPFMPRGWAHDPGAQMHQRIEMCQRYRYNRQLVRQVLLPDTPLSSTHTPRPDELWSVVHSGGLPVPTAACQHAAKCTAPPAARLLGGC